MKVVLINGSPRAKGNTGTALAVFAETLAEYGIETELLHIGRERIQGCLACGACEKSDGHRCIITDDSVNSSADRIAAAQGIVIGAPVYFVGMPGTLKSYLDRVFNTFWYKGNDGVDSLRFKVGAALAVGRRVGGIETLSQIKRYFEHAGMLSPSASYWPVTYGLKPGECAQDAEGQQLIKELAANTAWLVKAVDLGKKSIPLPRYEPRMFTNFIR